jgi:pyruvate/2-oxoglutarate/acetoin dehydrogenase E1 component/TPP-dependent pyruvate/acetoin dehydrogenase alpha subunit
MNETALQNLSFETFKAEILKDYNIACVSRETSLMGRREVLTGKAKFGIFGDGKEVAQIAMAKSFKTGDFRSGYYRDQTFMFASELSTVQHFFAQLYAHPSLQHDPFSAGRQMNGHFATPNVNSDGSFKPLATLKNITSDISPTAGQMVRGLGLGFASVCFRNIPELADEKHLSDNGNEVSFVTIGDASTSEGHFWETINAAGVLKIPLAVFVWDDGYGISVPKEFQTTKGSISEALSGFAHKDDSNGILIYKVKGWDYQGMCQIFDEGIEQCRVNHVPVVFHVEEITQPQGHSTSGSHERYKTAERLAWEKEWDCIAQFKSWILANGIAQEDELENIATKAKEKVKQDKTTAWDAFAFDIKNNTADLINILNNIANSATEYATFITEQITKLQSIKEIMRKDYMEIAAHILHTLGKGSNSQPLQTWYKNQKDDAAILFNTHLYNEGPKSALKVAEIKLQKSETTLNGYEVLNNYFSALFAANNKVLAFGEDVGHIGDVNQGFAGLQEKFGKQRISDTGIRELSIIGQAIGTAWRGLRPIAEIQYLDYLLYGLQPLSDDVATMHYRTSGIQSCPIIIRSRGHRLEGIWHSGSPMGMIINALRGMYICVPRNMVQAIGMYNTLLQSNDPGLVIECLNGYRLKENVPANLLTFTVPLGVAETIIEGTDITIVSYGSTLRIVQEAVAVAIKRGISCEVIDAQTLLPFDINHHILASLKKTNRILFVDEDVPGGAASYMYQQVMEVQGGYKYLDVAPRTLTAKAHRPPYGSDGDYFTKPNVEDVLEQLEIMMAE